MFLHFIILYYSLVEATTYRACLKLFTHEKSLQRTLLQIKICIICIPLIASLAYLAFVLNAVPGPH